MGSFDSTPIPFDKKLHNNLLSLKKNIFSFTQISDSSDNTLGYLYLIVENIAFPTIIQDGPICTT